MKQVLLILITIISISCKSQDCHNIPTKFSTYQQAIETVENSKFKINESINTSRSGWIKSAHFYSCDGITGFFIIELKPRKYIHANMPVSVWEKFKKAASFGSFYDYNIKGRYRLYLN